MKYVSTLNRSECAFQFFLGGRGIGKTYSTLSEQYIRAKEQGEKYIYLRLTEDEMSLCADKENTTNPYKRINHDKGYNVEFRKISKRLWSIAEYAEDEKILDIGLAASLLAFKNFRGADFYDYDFIFFDEFIPSESVITTTTMKKAGWLFVNAYETINRNRELEGYAPVKCIFCANSFSLNSPILAEFEIVNVIQGMIRRGQKRYTDKERDIYIELFDAPEVVDAKKQTALYRAMKNNEKFNALALDNKFTDESLVLMIYDVRLRDYKPHIQYGNVCIYVKKSDGSFYAAKRHETCPYKYSESERTRFVSDFYTIYKIAVLEHLIKFDSMGTKMYLDNALQR